MSQQDFIISDADGATVLADLNANFQALASNSSGTGAPPTIYTNQHWTDTNTPSSTYQTEYVYDGTDSIGMGRIDTTNNRYIPYNAAHGQCRLTKSGSNLLLSPYNGNVIIINGAPEIIPSAGVTLSPSGTANNTSYYIYAYMSGTTMTLEYSATTYVTNSTTGVATKNGDATRSLVGMARTDGSAAWVDSVTQRFTISYFNRRNIEVVNNFTTTRTTTSTSFVEVNSEIRNEFLVWPDEAVTVSFNGTNRCSGTSNDTVTSIGFDGTTAEDAFAYIAATANILTPCSVVVNKTLSEGYHYATLLGKVTAGTAEWTTNANSAGNRCVLTTVIRG